MITDLIQEIGSTLRGNKLRTTLTGFAVSWGIFLLICLLGAGNGLMNAFIGNMDDYVASNSMRVSGGWTTMPANGYQDGRRIHLDEGDIAVTEGREFADHIDIVSPVTDGLSATLAIGRKTVEGSVCGVTPSYMDIEKVVLRSGRTLNQADLQQRAKVIVLSSSQAKALSDGDIDDIIGQWVEIQGVAFRIVGIYVQDESSWRSFSYVPYTTMKGIFYPDSNVGSIYFTFHGIKGLQESEAFEKEYGAALKTRHDAHPDDPGALWIWNRHSQNIQMSQAKEIITIALWILSLLTLISGIVGVSNIMLISVKERTHEFGIRKAIGAKPRHILSLIIAESVTITALFGYIGMVLGMAACEIMDKTIGQKAVNIGFTEIHMLEDPTVGLSVALEATLLLIIAGTLAGLAPARKASQVRPIEALRAE